MHGRDVSHLLYRVVIDRQTPADVTLQQVVRLDAKWAARQTTLHNCLGLPVHGAAARGGSAAVACFIHVLPREPPSPLTPRRASTCATSRTRTPPKGDMPPSCRPRCGAGVE